jgi:hypothetical protein
VNLRDLLGDAAASHLDVDASDGPDGSVTWAAVGQPFAVLAGDGSTAEFRLDPAVAAAAIRTPDVSASNRGPGWVTFRPAALDVHAADRAAAWFASAHRRLTPA